MCLAEGHTSFQSQAFDCNVLKTRSKVAVPSADQLTNVVNVADQEMHLCLHMQSPGETMSLRSKGVDD